MEGGWANMDRMKEPNVPEQLTVKLTLAMLAQHEQEVAEGYMLVEQVEIGKDGSEWICFAIMEEEM